MTDHEKIKQKLAAFVDNELKEPERKKILEHLTHCSSCQEEVAFIQHLHHSTKEIAPKPEPDFEAKLSQQVWRKIRTKETEPARPKVRFFSIPRFAPILAGAVVLLLVVIVGINLFDKFSGTSKSKPVFNVRSIAPMAGLRTEPAQSETERTELGTKETQPLAEKNETKEMKNTQLAAGAARKAGATGTATKQTKVPPPPSILPSAGPEIGTGEARGFDALAAPTLKESTKKEQVTISGTNTLGTELATKPAKESEIINEKKLANKPSQAGISLAEAYKESAKIETIVSTSAVNLVTKEEPIDKMKVKGYFVVGVEPEPIKIAKPNYSESARRKKMSGDVVINAVVGLKGQVEYAEVLKSSGYGVLDTEALKAAKKSKFKPVIEKGKKVRTLTTIPFHFPPKEK